MHTLTVVSQPREWDSQKGGPMKSYTVKVEGDDGAYEIARKASSPAPTVGQKIDVAEVVPSNGNYPPKIKLAFGGKGGGGGRTPEEQARIQRQHGQEMAIRWAALAHARGKLPDDFKLGDLTAIIDWFDADTKAAKP
jgi:hypothetical protein